MLKIKIRQAKSASDLERIRALSSLLFASPVLPSSPAHAYFAAFYGKSPVGFAHIIAKKHSAVLRGLGVDSRFQGKGVGSRLLDAAVAYCTSKGMTHILLKVKATNDPALHLYLKKGFSGSFVDSSIIMSYKPPN